MASLSEVEIFDVLATNFRRAAEQCELLAWHPRRGYVLLQFLAALRACEGACRQACAHREDARWLPIGLMLGDVHKRAGRWVRAARTKDERNQAHPLFKKLADNLRALEYAAERLRTAATGHAGMILPQPLEGPHRPVRPVAVLLPNGSPWMH